MQIGFNLPVSGPMAAPATMAKVAQLGESMGFGYLTLTDPRPLPDTPTPASPYRTARPSCPPHPTPAPPTLATQTAGQNPPHPAAAKRCPLPIDLPRVDVIPDLPADARTCPCGTPMVEIGQDISEQLDIVPMQVRVLRHIRKRYGCPGSTHAPVTEIGRAHV